MTIGRVLNVYPIIPSCMVTATVVGDNTTTVIPVDSFVVNFDEDGGQLQHEPTGDTYFYTTVNKDAETITLAAGLPVGKTFTADDALYVYPLADNFWADVREDDIPGVEPIVVRVPKELRAFLPVGQRDEGAGEIVDLDYSGDEITIAGLQDGEPALDAGYIDTTTNPIPTSDGEPPDAAPTPVAIGVPRLIILQWDAIDNADPVIYDIHVSTTSGFAVSTSTYQASTAATMATVDRIDGMELDYDTDYFIKIVARDEDSPPDPTTPVGDEAVGRLDPNGTADIAVGAVTAANIEAVLLLAGKIITAEQGRRVELSNEGVVLYEQDGSVLVNLTTDQDAPATFNGEAVLTYLTALGLSVQGPASLDRGSTFTLQAGIQASSAQPAAVIGWPSETLDVDTAPSQKRGLFWDSSGSRWYYTVAGSGGSPVSTVKSVDVSGGDLQTHLTLPAGLVTDGGITRISTTWYLLVKDQFDSNTYWVRRYDSSWVFLGEWQYTNEPNGKRPAIGTDGTDVIIVRTNASGDFTFRHFNPSTGAAGTVVTSTNSPGNFDLVACHRIASGGGFGGARYVAARRTGGPYTSYVYNTSGVSQPNDVWPIADNDDIAGMGYNGTDFYHLGEGGAGPGGSLGRIVRYLSGNVWTTESSKWWVSFTWSDADATGGTHETTQSARKSFTMKRRARLTVTAPEIPDSGGTDDPDSVRVFVGRGSTDPGRTAMWLNSSPAAGVTTVFLDAVVFTAVANPPASNNFPGGTPGIIRDALLNPLLSGDGAWGTLPTGSIIPVLYSVADPPTLVHGLFLKINSGITVSRTTFARLFGVIGTTGGAGDGSTTFGLGDPRSRFLVGAGSYAALGANEGMIEANRTTLHSHTYNHTHPINDTNHNGTNTATGANTGGGLSRVQTIAGSASGSHNHGGATQGPGDTDTDGANGASAFPYLGVNFLIKT